MSNYNGCLAGSRVWEFRDATRTWITWSVGYDPPTPRAGSAAAAWPTLQVCNELAPSVMIDKVTAAGVARLLRTIRRREGLVILHERPFRGPSPPRAAGGEVSIRALARRLGCSRRQAAKFADSRDSADFGGDAARTTGTR